MKIMRWRADRKPGREELERIFREEGLEYLIEELPTGTKTKEHRHPFDEVRVVVAGTMRFNVAGNEFLLREGDRLDLPSNTKHWSVIEGDSDCLSIYAHRVT